METKSKFATIKVGREYNMRAFHKEMQDLRNQGQDVSLKGYLAEVYGKDYTPEKFYADAGIDLREQTVNKMLTTSDLSRWLFPEVMRDAIRRGLEYTPFFRDLITGEERVDSTGVTMPVMDFRSPNVDADTYRLRDVNEGATIPEAQVVVWAEKQVSMKKKARGLKQTYESIAFTPINLAAIYFEELGTRLGSDLDSEFIDIMLNGDQANGSESAPVIGATVAGTLDYVSMARAWLRFRRLNRNSAAMLASEADALTLLNMEAFQRTRPSGGAPNNAGGTTVNIRTPLPTEQDIYIHPDVPTGKLVLVDPARAAVQLTALPLLIESERIVERQINGEYVSIMTGFANIFRDGRLVLDYTTNLATNPGPTIPQ